MTKLHLRKLRAALADTRRWSDMKRRIRPLTNRELAEAEALERLGKRRQNLLRVIHAEKQRRARKPDRMLRLRVEVLK
jgi:hypothetical protein